MTSDQEKIDRLEADLKAKQHELEGLDSQVLIEGIPTSVKHPPQSVPAPDLEAQIRQSEAEVLDAQKRYEKAENE